MIDYIKGQITELTPTAATIECYGIGYHIHISLNTYGAIKDQESGKLYIYESIREDAHILFGFSDKHEREIFLHLISVSGVGPSIARVIVSTYNAKELENAIATGNVAVLQSVKGIGAKTAQRIIVDLKGKIKLTGEGSEVPIVGKNDLSEVGNAAVSALVMLGFVQVASQKVVAGVIKDLPGLSVEQIIKEALKRL